MRLQIISDTHLEFRQNRYPHIPRRAPNIALLGDIGKPFSNVFKRLLYDLSRRFDNVLLVAGNHEFYTSKKQMVTVSQIHERLEDLANMFPNVYYLNNRSMMIEGVRILGGTLWTAIPREMMTSVRKAMNDYRMIFTSSFPSSNTGVPLSPEHTNVWHEGTVAWLKEELSAPGYLDTPTVILTHHAPYEKGTSDPKYEDNARRCCYATDLSALFRPPIVAWAYGHTHYAFDQVVDGVRVVSNPLGYPKELECEEEALNNPPVLDIFRPPPGLERPN